MKQQPLLGFLFALITAMAWGSLPIALKVYRKKSTKVGFFSFI